MIYEENMVDYSIIKERYNNYCKKYYNLNGICINYSKKLHSNYDFNCNLNSFWHLRYFSKCLTKQINELSIPFVYICYYYELIINQDKKIYNYSLKKNYEIESLYIYFFYQIMYQIFKIIDNTYICIDRGLSVNVSPNSKSKEKDIAKKISSGFFSNNNVIIDFTNYINSYNSSRLKIIKDEYRNKYTHDFVNDIPKIYLDINKVKINYFDYKKSFDDMIELLSLLNNHLKKVDDVLILYIDNNKLN